MTLIKQWLKEQNVLAERALIKELKELRRPARKARWKEASRDPVLLTDISDIEVTFEPADAEATSNFDWWRAFQ